MLSDVLPPVGLVLEIASGTGQHVVHFAAALPALAWQPSERDARLRAAIADRVATAGLANLKTPLALDVGDRAWPLHGADALVCINMIHIAPWPATPALFEGAARILRSAAPLFLYGPYRRFGRHTAPSNELFDESLRARDRRWGVRDLERVAEAGAEAGFELLEVRPMPSNNFGLLFRKQ
jgi:hypothetical protein